MKYSNRKEPKQLGPATLVQASAAAGSSAATPAQPPHQASPGYPLRSPALQPAGGAVSGTEQMIRAVIPVLHNNLNGL